MINVLYFFVKRDTRDLYIWHTCWYVFFLFWWCLFPLSKLRQLQGLHSNNGPGK